jgi:hypothetical protein
MSESSSRTYVAVSRGRAAAIFGEGDQWSVQGWPAGPTAVNLTLRTAYVSYGFNAKAPRWLYAEVSGPAESIEDAIRRFPNAVRSLTPIFDVALNASVDDLDLHLGFDATHGREEREFFQNFLRDDPPTLRQVRRVHAGFLSALTEAIARHPDHVRIHRAASHYQQALRSWSFGDETRAVGQLWMGFEALTPVSRRQEMNRTDTSSAAELANALNVELKELDGTVRRTVLFAGDGKSYAETKDVSDGFEHGYRPLDELRVLARSTREALAAHLRKAIIQLSRVPEPTASEMLLQPYNTPIIGFPIAKYIRGTLKGPGEPAAPGERYPSLTWRTEIKSFALKCDGRHDVQWNDSVTAKIGSAIQLTDVRIELWSGDKIPPGTVTMERAAVDREDRSYGLPSPASQAPRGDQRPRGRWRTLLCCLRQFLRRQRDR